MKKALPRENFTLQIRPDGIYNKCPSGCDEKVVEEIQSITYRKETSEYRIVRRNLSTGKTSVTYANRLTDQEKLWAKINCKTRQEDPYAIHWTIHHGE